MKPPMPPAIKKRRKHKNTWLKPVLMLAGLLLLGGVTVLGIRGLMTDAGKPSKHEMQMVQLLRPPPPPPPPKPEEKPPEPVKKEEVKLDQPKPQDQPKDAPKPDQPPPAGKLGVDATAGAGNDAFGLAANKGGADLIGGGGGSRFAYYGVQVQQQIQDVLAKDDTLRKTNFRVLVKFWLNSDGSVQRFELAESTGDDTTDRALKNALTGIHRLRQAPPTDLPQPIGLRITSRS